MNALARALSAQIPARSSFVLDALGLLFLVVAAGLVHLIAGVATAGLSFLLLSWRYGR